MQSSMPGVTDLNAITAWRKFLKYTLHCYSQLLFHQQKFKISVLIFPRVMSESH